MLALRLSACAWGAPPRGPGPAWALSAWRSRREGERDGSSANLEVHAGAGLCTGSAPRVSFAAQRGPGKGNGAGGAHRWPRSLNAEKLSGMVELKLFSLKSLHSPTGRSPQNKDAQSPASASGAGTGLQQMRVGEPEEAAEKLLEGLPMGRTQGGQRGVRPGAQGLRVPLREQRVGGFSQGPQVVHLCEGRERVQGRVAGVAEATADEGPVRRQANGKPKPGRHAPESLQPKAGRSPALGRRQLHALETPPEVWEDKLEGEPLSLEATTRAPGSAALLRTHSHSPRSRAPVASGVEFTGGMGRGFRFRV